MTGDGLYKTNISILHNYGQSPFLMGKSTIFMAMFNSYVKLPDAIPLIEMVMTWGRFMIGFTVRYLYGIIMALQLGFASLQPRVG